MGPLYTVSYGMYLFVDFLILSKFINFSYNMKNFLNTSKALFSISVNWWRDYSTLADYIQKWRLLNSQMKVLPFKKGFG